MEKPNIKISILLINQSQFIANLGIQNSKSRYQNPELKLIYYTSENLTSRTQNAELKT